MDIKDFKAQVAIGLVCLLLGFGVTLQLKSVKVKVSSGNTQIKRSEELQKELNKFYEINNDLNAQIFQLKSDLDMYRKEATDSSGYAKVLSEQLTRAEVLAGLSAVEGPGIIVSMNDSKYKGDFGVEDYLIHEDDIRRVVNELYAAGAEVISINDDRLISTSAIRCVGPVVVVNNNKYAPPFIIKAIGNGEALEAALTMRGGVLEPLINIYKIEIDIRREKNITMQRFNGVTSFKYATEIVKEAK